MKIRERLSALFRKQEQEGVYQFVGRSLTRRKRTCRIEIRGEQALADFDMALRDAFDLDWADHLSEFHRGDRWPAGGFGHIDPFGGGRGSQKRVWDLRLKPGEQVGWVYDFGDEYHHALTLEAIVAPEVGVEYPRITKEKPKPRSKRRSG